MHKVICGFVALVSATVPLLAQTTRIDGGGISMETFGFYWETHLTPPVPPLAEGFGTSASRDASGVIHRVVLDRRQKLVFGYDVRVEPEAGSDTYRLVFEPLSMMPEQRQRLLGIDFASWEQLPGPGLSPGPGQSLRARRTEMTGIRRGQVVELNLLTTASGQTLTDYVTIQPPWQTTDGFRVVPAPAFHFIPGPTRDFMIGDVQLELVAPRVSINGKPEPSSERARSEGTARGAVVWFYLPNRGRYVLSLLPRSELGFRRAGEVRGSTARFTLGNEAFTLINGEQIAPGRAPFNLYVLHDPTWRPTHANANLDAFMMDGADRAEYVVAR